MVECIETTKNYTPYNITQHYFLEKYTQYVFIDTNNL